MTLDATKRKTLHAIQRSHEQTHHKQRPTTTTTSLLVHTVPSQHALPSVAVPQTAHHYPKYYLNDSTMDQTIATAPPQQAMRYETHSIPAAAATTHNHYSPPSSPLKRTGMKRPVTVGGTSPTKLQQQHIPLLNVRRVEDESHSVSAWMPHSNNTIEASSVSNHQVMDNKNNNKEETFVDDFDL